MGKKKKLFFLFILIIFIVFATFYFLISEQKTYLTGNQILNPPIGMQTVSYIKSFSTTQVATLTSQGLGQTVYAFDGASGFCADLIGNDAQEELYYYSGDRFGIVGPNNENQLYIDGRGIFLYRDGAAIVFRIANDALNPNKYVVVKLSDDCGGATPCQDWQSHRQIAVHALNNFNSYTTGQKIAFQSFMSVPTSTSYAFWLTSNDVVLKPNQPVFVTASSYVFEDIAVYKLLLQSDGTISFTLSGEIANPVYPLAAHSCSGGGTTTGAGPHRGNAMFNTKLCRVNFNGDCTGVYDEYLFNNDFFRISSTGTITQVGSWHSLDGQAIPVVQTPGSAWTFCIPYGATYDHVDSSHVFNAGTEAHPDYRLIIMWDGGGARTVSARISVNQNGDFSLTPLWATIGGSISGVGDAQQMALMYVKGLPGGPHIVNGQYVFDAFTGQTLAYVNAAVIDPNNLFVFVDPRPWPTTPQGSYVTDRGGGFLSEPYQTTNVLRHVLPTSESIAEPIRRQPPYQLSFTQTGSNLPAGPLMTQTEGFYRDTRLCADYNSQTNSISFKLIKFRDQQHISLLQSYDEAPFITGVTQTDKDVVLKFIEQTQTAGHRGYDEWTFKKELQQLGTCPNCPNSPINLQATSI